MTAEAADSKKTVHQLSDSESDSDDSGDISIVRQDSSSKRTHELSDSDSSNEGTTDHQKFQSKKIKLTSAMSMRQTSATGNNEKIQRKDRLIATAGSSGSREASLDTRPLCRYGKDCYRKNPLHFTEFQHPQFGSSKFTVLNPAQPNRHNTTSIKERLGDSKYNFLLTHVTGIQDRYNNMIGIHIKDILSPEFGNLVSSAQFNYCIDIPWLVQQYPAQFRSRPLLIVHGEQRESKSRLDLEAMKFPHVKLCQARLDIMYGTHHTKMMLLLYDSGMRVVIHTANLVQQDWHQKTQGVWVSPLLPKLMGTSGGDSPTFFRKDLVEYLSAYKSAALSGWTTHIQEHDFSSVSVHLVSSVPGRHTGDKKCKFGHLKLRTILSKNGPASATQVKGWPVIGQFSSIGSLGSTKDTWLCGEWLRSLSSTQCVQSFGGGMSGLKLIYPSKENVRQSLEGYAAGASLPYSINTAKKQLYLKEFLHEWKCSRFGRDRASPHIKTYTRISPDLKQSAWFLVTSANLSKAAWGVLEKNQSQLMIRSYEMGVLFLPQFFNCKEFLPIGDDAQNSFPLPFDVPLKAYSPNDQPWIWDIPYKDRPDSKGVMWVPS